MKRLTKIGIKYNTDKATSHGFTEIYEEFFSMYSNPRILELGVFQGASLKMYNEYYDGRCTIVGLDNGRDKLTYHGNGTNIRVVIGNQAKREDMQKCLDLIPEYDIIVDDGGHQMYEQQASLAFLFDYLAPGGTYIVEDLHTSFRGFYNHKRIPTTLDVLTELERGEYISLSRYFPRETFDTIRREMKSIQIFWKTPDRDPKNSITAVIVKK